MSRKLTASDRSALIRLASTMPVGSPERKAILASLNSASAQSGLSKVSFAPPKRKGARVRIMREVASWQYHVKNEPAPGSLYEYIDPATGRVTDEPFTSAPLPVGTQGVVKKREKNYGRITWSGGAGGSTPGGGHEYEIEFIDPEGDTHLIRQIDDSYFLDGFLK